MNLYVFSSKNVTNIWAGIGARRWAISERASETPGPAARVTIFPIGSLGVIYVSGSEGGYLTTPFITCTQPDTNAEATDVWPETWVCPFKIHPLGTPERRLSIDTAQDVLPCLQDGGHWHHILKIAPVAVFSPVEITEEDWQIIVHHLVA